VTAPFPLNAVVDARLGAHLCVWCGKPLSDSDPSGLFCHDWHQKAWHAAVNGRPLPPPVDAPPDGSGVDELRCLLDLPTAG
jgi:hypothetical protein